MASLLKILSLLVLLLILVSCQVDQVLYSGFNDVGASNLTMNGVAKIEHNRIHKLTNESSMLKGHAFYPSHFQLKNSTSRKVDFFSSSFAFAIVPEYPNLGGHGLAFTIETSKDINALPSQYMGLLNSSDNGNFSNHIFVVQFDTVQDFEFGYINDNHVGIDINNMQSNASASVSLVGLTLKSGKPIVAWVDYDSRLNLISVALFPTSSKPKTLLLIFNVDLSPVFHDTMYIGFSASTGLLASSHYIFNWSFKINGPAPPLDLYSLPQLPKPKKKQTSFIIGVSISIVVIVLLSIYIGIYFYKKIKNTDLL